MNNWRQIINKINENSPCPLASVPGKQNFYLFSDLSKYNFWPKKKRSKTNQSY